MKKYLLVLLALFIATPASASLWDYYHEKGLALPSIQSRLKVAKACGISDYTGSATQNIALEACLRTIGEQVFGSAPVPTSSAHRMYVESPDWQLFNGAAAADTTLTLDDLEDIYGNEVTMSDLGDKGYGRINPDGVSESITFTGITTNSDGTKTLTGVRTVLAKYPYTETSGLARSHSIGSLFRLSNTAGFYNDLANKYNDEVIDGEWIFSTTSARGICFINTKYCIRSNSSTLQWTNDDWVNAYNLNTSTASALTASTTAGINISDAQVAVIVSTTQGMTFGADGRLYHIASTTTGLANSSTGIYIVTSTLSSLISTSTATPNFIPRATSAGTLPITWIATSTTSTRGFLRSTSTGDYYGDLVTSIINTSTLTRAYAVSYRNDSGRTKFITVMSDVSGSTVVNAFVSSTAGVGVRVGTVSSNDASSSILPMSFMVPPDWTYSVSIITGAAGQLSGWVEFEL